MFPFWMTLMAAGSWKRFTLHFRSYWMEIYIPRILCLFSCVWWQEAVDRYCWHLMPIILLVWVDMAGQMLEWIFFWVDMVGQILVWVDIAWQILARVDVSGQILVYWYVWINVSGHWQIHVGLFVWVDVAHAHGPEGQLNHQEDHRDAHVGQRLQKEQGGTVFICRLVQGLPGRNLHLSTSFLHSCCD